MGEAKEVRLEVEPSNLDAGTCKQEAGSWKLGAGSRKLLDSVFAVLVAPLCAACKRPLDHPTRGPVCQACWDHVPTAANIHNAIGLFEGSLRDIIHALKYDGRRSLARPLGERLARAGAAVLAGADIAVPVPLHRSRLRQRGFNQAAEIAAHLGLPVVNALRRTRATPSQADLPAARRHANVRGAFALRRGADVPGKIVVLVDDVSTTGATLNACAGVLIRAGAREVRALTVARVVSQPR